MSGVYRIINNISNTNNVREGISAPSDGGISRSCSVFETRAQGIKGHSVMLDLLRKHLTCSVAQLENEINTFNPNPNHLKFLPSIPHLPSRRKKHNFNQNKGILRIYMSYYVESILTREQGYMTLIQQGKACESGLNLRNSSTVPANMFCT